MIRYDFTGVGHDHDSLWLSLLHGSSDFSLVFLSITSEKSFILYKASATAQAIKLCPVRPRVLSSWGLPLIREAEGYR